jgi:hypothetical protein
LSRAGLLTIFVPNSVWIEFGFGTNFVPMRNSRSGSKPKFPETSQSSTALSPSPDERARRLGYVIDRLAPAVPGSNKKKDDLVTPDRP